MPMIDNDDYHWSRRVDRHSDRQHGRPDQHEI